MNAFTVIPHKKVKNDDEPVLIAAGLFENYMAIVKILKENPYSRELNGWELMVPHNRKIYSCRINNQHRVVYTVSKREHIVKIWSAWSHYEKRLPRNCKPTD
ncbi:type II toxin-antitoxin system RelE/ParE family toxin [Furfurilactobacillus cerevisiae]|uniref:Txe/YoeB family addiction module toxin n=1 Tax=Furfurilactobacillus rossiae TaxID=231049 RepID=A0A7C9IUD3_9LACO|nr:Txe/YoeB family addiction module toxin [Furfurilactobacillus milii]